MHKKIKNKKTTELLLQIQLFLCNIYFVSIKCHAQYAELLKADGYVVLPKLQSFTFTIFATYL